MLDVEEKEEFVEDLAVEEGLRVTLAQAAAVSIDQVSVELALANETGRRLSVSTNLLLAGLRHLSASAVRAGFSIEVTSTSDGLAALVESTVASLKNTSRDEISGMLSLALTERGKGYVVEVTDVSDLETTIISNPDYVQEVLVTTKGTSGMLLLAVVFSGVGAFLGTCGALGVLYVMHRRGLRRKKSGEPLRAPSPPSHSVAPTATVTSSRSGSSFRLGSLEALEVLSRDGVSKQSRSVVAAGTSSGSSTYPTDTSASFPEHENVNVVVKCWSLGLVDRGSSDWQMLTKIFDCEDGELGFEPESLFRRASRVRELDGYSKLRPVAVWELEDILRKEKYQLELQDVRQKMLSFQAQTGFASAPQLRAKTDALASDMQMDFVAGERPLLLGVPAESVMALLDSGDFFGLGSDTGVVLAEDVSTMNQYTSADDPGSTALKYQHSVLYTSADLVPPGRVYYCFVCRAILGFSLFTKDGKVTSDSYDATLRSPAGLPVFHDERRRELRSIPKVSPMTPFQSLVVEAGPHADGHVLARSREVVVMHPSQLYPQYLIAFQRE